MDKDRRMLRYSTLLGFAPSLLAAAAHARAASTVVLPPSLCPSGDAIFRDGFELAAATLHAPSNGSGGIYPSNVTRIVSVTGVGSRTYYLHLPPTYAPTRAWPIMLVLHGATGSAAMAPAAAKQVRNDWSSWSDSGGFVVIAPVGYSTQGGWGASGDIEEIEADLDDATAAYNIEQTHVYLWRVLRRRALRSRSRTQQHQLFCGVRSQRRIT